MESEIYHAALTHFGKDHQIIKAIEEMSELIKELTKYLLSKEIYQKTYQVHEEIADTQIMLEQLKIIFDRNTINLYQKRKLKRLEEKIKSPETLTSPSMDMHWHDRDWIA